MEPALTIYFVTNNRKIPCISCPVWSQSRRLRYQAIQLNFRFKACLDECAIYITLRTFEHEHVGGMLGFYLTNFFDKQTIFFDCLLDRYLIQDYCTKSSILTDLKINDAKMLMKLFETHHNKLSTK